jgi:organic hydroperoxide reductase OsmC/OhrA
MSQEHLYEVHLDWKEGRTGELSSPVLNTTITCATPPEFPGGVPGIWSPEHLFAASINSCFMATFLAIAYNFKLEIDTFSCKTIIKLEMTEGRYQITHAALFPEVTLPSGTDKEKAIRVLEKAKAGCLVTNSIKSVVSMESVVV